MERKHIEIIVMKQNLWKNCEHLTINISEYEEINKLVGCFGFIAYQPL